jgi:hypothetical protein
VHGAASTQRRGSTIESVLARAREAERILTPREQGGVGSSAIGPSQQELELMRSLEELELSVSSPRATTDAARGGSTAGSTPHSARGGVSPLEGSVRRRSQPVMHKPPKRRLSKEEEMALRKSVNDARAALAAMRAANK